MPLLQKKQGWKQKDKPKKTNPIVQGMKKKAQGIFELLMDLGMKFVGFKILEWIGKEENQEKGTKIIEFFQGGCWFHHNCWWILR